MGSGEKGSGDPSTRSARFAALSFVGLASSLLLAGSAHAQAPGAQAPGVQGKPGEAPTAQQPKGAEQKAPDASFPGVEEAGRVPKAPERRVPRRPTGPQPVLEASTATEVRAYASEKAARVAALPKGTLVLGTGEPPSAGFLRVSLPGGFPGFVHANWLEVGADGLGRTKGTFVSFRHRPVLDEPPLVLLSKGARFKALERKGSFWRVLSNPEVKVWVPAEAMREVAKVDLAKGAGGGLAAAITDVDIKKRLEHQIAKAEAPWREALEVMSARVARERELADFGRAVADARAAYDEERRKAAGDVLAEDLGKIDVLVRGLQDRLAKLDATKEPVADGLDALRAEVERRRLVQEMRRVVAEAPKKAEIDPARGAVEAAVRGPAVDPRRQFVVTGWLEYRPGAGDYTPYRVTKGGRLLYYLQCRSGRYDLADFVGREVGLRGEVSRPASADVRVVDIARIVILSGR